MFKVYNRPSFFEKVPLYRNHRFSASWLACYSYGLVNVNLIRGFVSVNNKTSERVSTQRTGLSKSPVNNYHGGVKKKNLPPLFYKKVYMASKENSSSARDILHYFIKQCANKDLSINEQMEYFLSNSAVAIDKNNVALYRGITSWANNFPQLVFSKFNMDKLFEKNKKRANLRLWKAKRRWAWKYLKRIHATKKLVRSYNRVSHWSLARLNYAYFYDIFMFWFVLYFRKLESFSYKFFFQLWLNIYFSQVLFSLSALDNITSYKSLLKESFFSYHSIVTNAKAVALGVKKLIFYDLVVYFQPLCFTSFFKLISIFWNRYKVKHFDCQIASWRWKWKFKYNLRFKGLAKWKRRKIKTRYFFTKKHLRLRFRKQHGYGLVFNYFLCSQLKRLKKISHKFLFESVKAKHLALNWYESHDRNSVRSKTIVGYTVKNFKKASLYKRLKSSKVRFLNNIIKYKESLFANLIDQKVKRKKLAREIEFLKIIRKNIKGFFLLSRMQLLTYVLLRARIISLPSSQSVNSHAGNVQKIRNTRNAKSHDPRKRLRALINQSFVMKLLSGFFLCFFPLKIARKHFSTFWDIAAFRLSESSGNRDHLEAKVLGRGVSFLVSLLGKRFLESYVKEKFLGDKLPNSSENTSYTLLFLKKKLLSLKKQAALKNSFLGQANKLPESVDRDSEKIHNHKLHFYPRASFHTLHNKLTTHKLSLKFFKNLRFQSKMRKRFSKINRRKLLIVNDLKKVLWKAKRTPVFLSRVGKTVIL